jgi:hypothetical protein
MKKVAYSRLSDDWLTEGLIDVEFKKYKLLAFLQSVDKRFNDKRLYPPFSDLIFHYKNLLHFQESKETFIRNLPKTLKEIDLVKLKLEYEQKFENPEFMNDLNRIIEFALPKIGEKINTGKSLYDEVENGLKIEPIGLRPLNQNEGYLIYSIAGDSYAHIFEYNLTLFKTADSKYRAIHTNYLQKIRKSISNTFESIKLSLIKKYKKLPNPATFVVESQINSSMEETLLPISKRLLVQMISN